jgi:hypothetical protein
MTTDDFIFLKSSIKDVKTGKKHKVRYSKGGYTKQSGLSEETISIYAKGYESLPKALNPSNNTNSQIDYFDTDTIRILPNSKYYRAVLRAMQKK